MDVATLQAALGALPDGQWGPASRKTLLDAFRNMAAPGVDEAFLDGIATRLGCTVRQIRAFAAVESSGGGYDLAGRPKLLFERHKFHRFTGGKYSPAWYSMPKGGGYAEDLVPGDGANGSWGKLNDAIAHDVDAAFMACSWGKFQVLGEWWDDLAYPSPFAMALSCVPGEAGHYEMFVRYIEHFHLVGELRRVSSNPETNRAIAAAYNGPGYREFDYHLKLARAMA